MNIVSRNVRVYYLTQLFHALIFTIPIWIVFYLERITVPQLSFLVTFEYLVQMLLEMPSGALADLIGRRNTNLIGFLIGAIAYLLFPLAHDFWFIAFLSLLIGTSNSFRSGSEEALMYDTFKQAKNESGFSPVYANGNTIYQFGLIIGNLVGGFLFEINTNLPYILYGISQLLGTVAVAFYFEPQIDSVKFTIKNYFLQMQNGAREVFGSVYAKYLSLYYIFVGGIAWSSTLFFNSYMLINLGFSDSQRGLLAAVMRFVNIVIITRVLKDSRIFNYHRTILFFPLLMLLGYLPGRWLNGVLGLPFVQMVMIVTTARWIILTPLTNQVFSSRYRATAISFLSLLIGVVYITVTSISGPIINLFGLKTMYSLLGIISFLTVVPLATKLLSLQSNK